MTASGDGSAHIWKAAVIPDRLAHAIGGVSSEESADSESEDTGGVHYPKEINQFHEKIFFTILFLLLFCFIKYSRCPWYSQGIQGDWCYKHNQNSNYCLDRYIFLLL